MRLKIVKNKKYKTLFLSTTQIIAIICLIIHTIRLVILSISNNKIEFIYTTYITIYMVAFAYIFKLDNEYLNAIACVNFLQFYFILDPLHIILAILQTIIILLRVQFSKKGIVAGVIFWGIYMSVIDDVYRAVNDIIVFLPNRAIFIFSVVWLLIISTMIVTITKYKEGCLNE